MGSLSKGTHFESKELLSDAGTDLDKDDLEHLDLSAALSVTMRTYLA